MVEERKNVLGHAVRLRVIAKYCGQLFMMLGLLTLAPLLAAVLERGWSLALQYTLLCAGMLLFGSLLARLTAPEKIQVNEALVITFMMFLLAALLMSWPMAEPGVAFMDALFESISGVTTTGLSTLGTVENRSDTFLFTRAWMQWYGGLGFVVLSIALLIGNQAASRRLLGPTESNETLTTTTRAHAFRTLIVYCSLTVVGLVIVWPLVPDGYTALRHVLSAVSTGGFSTHDNSLAGLDSRPAAIAIMFVSFISAVSLYLYWRAVHVGWREGLKTFFTDVEFRGLLIACLLSGALLVLLGWINNSDAPWYQGLMNAVSAQTTTGFSITEISEMDAGSKVVMILSMLVGGSVGSSAGGFKILRLLILLRLLQLLLRRTTTPLHAISTPYLGQQKLESEDAILALQIILLFLMIIFLSWIPFVVLGYDPLDSLFEVVSASGTVGLSSGISRPELEPLLKGILCIDMLAGRVEIFALLVVLYPRTWFGRREKTS